MQPFIFQPLTILSLALIAYCFIAIVRNPKTWLRYLQIAPLIAFMAYARLYGKTTTTWIQAFIFSGIIAAIVITVLFHRRVLMDRIYLGANLFLVLGGIGFLFKVPLLIEWYRATNGGPLFSCIAAVGICTMLFTKTGFLGKPNINKDAVRFGSFLLLAATFIALTWSVKANDDLLLFSTIIPFIILKIVQDQLMTHIS